jgi:hypothetical protein
VKARLERNRARSSNDDPTGDESGTSVQGHRTITF